MGIQISASEIDRKYQVVNGNTTVNSDHIIPNGKTLYISEFGGNAVQKDNVMVKIIFDPSGSNETLVSTTGDTVQNSNRSFLGDGVKIMRISLINNDVVSHTL